MEYGTYLIGKNRKELSYYVHGNRQRKRPALIICPGGGYVQVSAMEDEPAVMPFLAAGYNVFVLHYSVGREQISISRPEEELAASVEFVRKYPGLFGIDPEKIAVMGFSAGGHLAASLACHWRRYGDESRPAAAVLCYPVITMGRHTHEVTMKTIAGNDEDREYYSLETQVSRDVPPCYIWHTASDPSVPVENSLLFASALSENGIGFEMHIYPKGEHGLSVARRETDIEEPSVQGWVDEAVAFLDKHLGFVY